MNDLDLSRFWQKVQKTAECWMWAGASDQNGYGMVKHQGKTHRAHRLIWQHVRGVIPEGMMVDHICHNKACVNLDHLRIATRKQNAEHQLQRSNNTSGYRGVSWHRTNKKWQARISHNNEFIFCGYFDDAKDAAAAAQAKRNELFTFNDADRSAA